jgi:hypothetical protein
MSMSRHHASERPLSTSDQISVEVVPTLKEVFTPEDLAEFLGISVPCGSAKIL